MTSLAALLLGASLLAGEPSPEQLDQQRQLNRAMEAVENLRQAAANAHKEFRYRCMRALGHTQFCACLAEQRPVILSFGEFMLTASQSKDDVGYAKLSDDDKSVYDAAMRARNACVAKLGFN